MARHPKFNLEVSKQNYLDVDKYCGNDIAKDLSKSDIELVKRYEIAPVLSRYRFGDVDGNCPPLKADAQTQNHMASESCRN